MYYEAEIKGGRKFWGVWLEGFAVGERKRADARDRSRLAVAISNNFHKTKRARFKTEVDKNDPDILWVIREA